VVDNAAQPEAEACGEHQIDAGNHARGEHRLRLDKDPECQRKPDGVVGYIGNEVVAKDLIKRIVHGAPAAGQPTLAGYRDLLKQ
jgi:hypothetical protein